MSSHKPQYGNFFKFEKDDIFHNRLKTYPEVEFFIYSGSVYYNNENQNAMNPNTPNGCVNLYELNVNKSGDQLIHPFITKEGSFTNFKTISTSEFNHDFVFGDVISGSYPLTASISVDRYDAVLSTAKKRVLYALRNSLDFNSKLSMHYAYSSDLGDKETQPLNLISVPSIFYGSSIKKGSVVLKYYVSGSLIAEASDTKRNGELIQTSGSLTGSTVGVVLYNEGFMLLTSSVPIALHTEKYLEDPVLPAVSASWQYFGVTGSGVGAPSSSYSINFKGINYINTLTMFAHAKENQLNFSNNITFLTTASFTAATSSTTYIEPDKADIKNIMSSSYATYSASYQPVTYISKVALYDEDKNLIAIAALANPVKKLEDRSYTFKLKLDI